LCVEDELPDRMGFEIYTVLHILQYYEDRIQGIYNKIFELMYVGRESRMSNECKLDPTVDLGREMKGEGEKRKRGRRTSRNSSGFTE